jgi:hypothetical protein
LLSTRPSMLGVGRIITSIRARCQTLERLQETPLCVTRVGHTQFRYLRSFDRYNSAVICANWHGCLQDFFSLSQEEKTREYAFKVTFRLILLIALRY